MIFRNRRQFIPIDAYHNINGTQYLKIHVRNDLVKNFKHPYYEHDRSFHKIGGTQININGQPNGHNDPEDTRLIIKSVRQGTDSTYIGIATIKSMKATANSHVSYHIQRLGSYEHDLSNIRQDIDNIYSADAQKLHVFIPRGANTDIYGDETQVVVGATLKQYWT